MKGADGALLTWIGTRTAVNPVTIWLLQILLFCGTVVIHASAIFREWCRCCIYVLSVCSDAFGGWGKFREAGGNFYRGGFEAYSEMEVRVL
jgi:hypothetical protein